MLGLVGVLLALRGELGVLLADACLVVVLRLVLVLATVLFGVGGVPCVERQLKQDVKYFRKD